MRHVEFPSQISATARPERASDLKPATRCVLNERRGKQGTPRGGVLHSIPAVLLSVVVQQLAIIYLSLWLSSGVATNAGVHKKMVTFPSLL